jgi:hypothetical protein
MTRRNWMATCGVALSDEFYACTGTPVLVKPPTE